MTDAATDALYVEALTKSLFTAVVGDVLDQMGYPRQFLPAAIAPLSSSTVLAGRAMPVVEADIAPDGSLAAAPHLAAKRFGLMLEALDDLRPGEIYLATGASLAYALWGGLMSTRAMHLGAAGAILDGYVRDAREIEALGFPVFARGTLRAGPGAAREGRGLSRQGRDRRHRHRARRSPLRRPGGRAGDPARGRGGGYPPRHREGDDGEPGRHGDPQRHERPRGFRDLWRDVRTSPMTFDIGAVRAQFPALSLTDGGKRRIYFDNPGGTQVSRFVIERMTDCLVRANANLGGPFATSIEAGRILDEARQGMADFLHAAGPEEIVFGQNMTSLTLHHVAFARPPLRAGRRDRPDADGP